MHRWSGDGGWHSGAGREQTVCANIKCARVLQLLLPKVMSNRILPLAQELNLNGIETNGTVYIDLSGAIIVSEIRV